MHPIVAADLPGIPSCKSRRWQTAGIFTNVFCTFSLPPSTAILPEFSINWDWAYFSNKTTNVCSNWMQGLAEEPWERVHLTCNSAFCSCCCRLEELSLTFHPYLFPDNPLSSTWYLDERKYCLPLGVSVTHWQQNSHLLPVWDSICFIQNTKHVQEDNWHSKTVPRVEFRNATLSKTPSDLKWCWKKLV